MWASYYTWRLLEVVNIKTSLNLGLSKVLKKAFPDIKNHRSDKISKRCNRINSASDIVGCDQSENRLNLHPNWVAGFVAAEGSFIVVLTKLARLNIGYQVSVAFKISQDLRDVELLQSFISFGCVNTYEISDRDMCECTYQKFLDNLIKIASFFRQYTLLACKSLDFKVWCEVVTLIENKSYLTEVG